MHEVVFCHGLESGPHGRKYQALKGAGVDVYSPDFQGMNLGQRVEGLVELLSGWERLPVLVGSSYGGITAVIASMRLFERGKKIPGMVLCAPALERDEPPANEMPLDCVARTVVIHGVGDEVVPLEVSRRYCVRFGLELIEVEDEHPLAGSLEVILREVEKMVEVVRETSS